MAMARPTLDGFRSFLEEFDIGELSINNYVSDVRIALDGKGLIARLRSDGGAPKSRRRYLAAFKHWAEYTEDADLTKALKRVRLPPPRRKVPKVPLERVDYDRLVDELGHAKYLTPPVRGVLGLLACRGLRCGDALRLRRAEVDKALEAGVLSYEAKGKRRLEFRVLKTYRRHLELLQRSFEAAPKAMQVDQLVAPRAKPKGRRASAAKSIERALVRLGVHAGVHRLHPHRLRRTYAVEYLRSMQGDPEALMKLTSHMQWAQMTTALEYVDYVRSEDLDAAAERAFAR